MPSRHAYPVAPGSRALREGVVVPQNQLRRACLPRWNRKQLGWRPAEGGTGPGARLHDNRPRFQTGNVVLIPKQQRDLLGSLSYVCHACPQSTRNLPLLQFASHAGLWLLDFCGFQPIRSPRTTSAGTLTVLHRTDASGNQPFSRPFSLKRRDGWWIFESCLAA